MYTHTTHLQLVIQPGAKTYMALPLGNLQSNDETKSKHTATTCSVQL